MNLASSGAGNRSNRQSLKTLHARRKLWLKVHLWLGLSLGLVLAVTGLTGSVLVFWHDLDQAFNAGLYKTYPNPTGKQKSIDQLLAAATNSAPAGWESGWATAETENGNFLFNFYYSKPNPAAENADTLTLAVNPFTAKIVARRIFYHASNPFKHSLVGFFFKLHYALFLGEFGVNLMGWLAVVFLISALTGLILWWPLSGNWKRALTIKRNASRERLNYDLHQSAGFYSAVVLIAVLISGIHFNLPEQFRWLVSRFSPLTAAPVAQASEAAAGDVLQQTLEQIRRQSLRMVLQHYGFTPDLSAPFTACFNHVPELKPYIVDNRCFFINRHSGVVMSTQDARTGSAGDTFLQWQWPLHSGQAFGWPGRIAVFITGLMCPLLFITGVIRWLQKRRVKQARNV